MSFIVRIGEKRLICDKNVVLLAMVPTIVTVIKIIEMITIVLVVEHQDVIEEADQHIKIEVIVDVQ